MNKNILHFENEIVFPLDGTKMTITSPDFREDGMLPRQYTCDGANINPALDISPIPSKTASLVIILDDPFHPEHWWTHWMAWNIPPLKHIPEARKMEAEGLNDFNSRGYSGPCPSYGTHRYHFKIYALDTLLALPVNAHVYDLQNAMNGHILGFGQITARYYRK